MMRDFDDEFADMVYLGHVSEGNETAEQLIVALDKALVVLARGVKGTLKKLTHVNTMDIISATCGNAEREVILAANCLTPFFFFAGQRRPECSCRPRTPVS
jgi:hypothetical protein